MAHLALGGFCPVFDLGEWASGNRGLIAFDRSGNKIQAGRFGVRCFDFLSGFDAVLIRLDRCGTYVGRFVRRA
jgi:hypothetical protein